MSVSEPVANADDADALRLAELGYKQELHRGMSGFSNFAVSFSIISVLAGCITTYYLAMDAGGPLAISLGWPVVGLFVLCVALAMAEVCSAYPTAGGLYFWAGRAGAQEQADLGLVRRAGSTSWARSPSRRRSTTARRSRGWRC